MIGARIDAGARRSARKRKRPAMDRAIPLFERRGRGPDRVRKRERAARRLSPLPASDPTAGRDLSDPGLYWPTLGSCCMVERSALRAGFHARGCKECSLSASRTPMRRNRL